MTEIVADKTVEVVKNAIETADGALDLYNKYLDQVIPWQTFQTGPMNLQTTNIT